MVFPINKFFFDKLSKNAANWLCRSCLIRYNQIQLIPKLVHIYLSIIKIFFPQYYNINLNKKYLFNSQKIPPANKLFILYL
jgi:hypothetical protein